MREPPLLAPVPRADGRGADSMMAAAPIDADGNLDYKGLAYVITHGQDDEEAAADE